MGCSSQAARLTTSHTPIGYILHPFIFITFDQFTVFALAKWVTSSDAAALLSTEVLGAADARIEVLEGSGGPSSSSFMRFVAGMVDAAKESEPPINCLFSLHGETLAVLFLHITHIASTKLKNSCVGSRCAKR